MKSNFKLHTIMIKKFQIMATFIFSSFLINAYAIEKEIISIDVGHYQQSQGTVSAYGDFEFSYNQELSQYVAQSFASKGYSVNLIGYNGDGKNLVNRARLADNSSIFISIHHDALQAQDLQTWNYNGKKLPFNDDVSGFGVFVSTKNPQFEKSLACAKTVAQQLIKTGFQPNYYHNKDIKGEQKKLFFKDLPVYQYDNLIVLKSTNVPAILIEAGVLTNRKEAKWIKQNDIRTAFSNTVSLAVINCLTK